LASSAHMHISFYTEECVAQATDQYRVTWLWLARVGKHFKGN